MKDYRLCWYMNKSLGLNYHREEDLEVNNKSRQRQTCYSRFICEDELNRSSYTIISNKYHGNFLMDELKSTDYLFIIRGAYSDETAMEFLKKSKSIPEILTAFKVDPKKLKKGENLIF